MKEIEELQEEVTINEMIDVLLLDQLNAIYHQHGSQSNYYAERRDSTRFALLNRFRELQEYKDAFEPLWRYCVDEAKIKIKTVKKITKLENENKTLLNERAEFVKENVELQQRAEQAEEQVERLRCCGNCCNYHFEKESHCYVNGNYDYDKSPSDYCDNWLSDGLTREGRK